MYEKPSVLPEELCWFWSKLFAVGSLGDVGDAATQCVRANSLVTCLLGSVELRSGVGLDLLRKLGFPLGFGSASETSVGLT